MRSGASWWARTKGLIGRRDIPAGFALVIRPCRGIHTFMLARAIDATYDDRAEQIVRILNQIKPWRLGPLDWRSDWVIEMPAGTAWATGMQLGDVVEIAEVGGHKPDT